MATSPASGYTRNTGRRHLRIHTLAKLSQSGAEWVPAGRYDDSDFLGGGKNDMCSSLCMYTLPSELIILLVPDPDTLGRMLRVCKYVMAALTTAGTYKLIDTSDVDKSDKDLGIKVSNDAVTFAVSLEGQRVICEKTCGCNVDVVEYTFGQMHRVAGIPKYIRIAGRIAAFMSGIGWDTIRYRGKYMLKLMRTGNFSYARVKCSDTLLVSNLEGNTSQFRLTFVNGNDSVGYPVLCDVTVYKQHALYEKIACD